MTSLNACNNNWLRPEWPVPAHVRALCTTRAGGVSRPPYDSLNLGTHVGDLAEHVATNRQILQNSLGAPPVFLNQVHGTTVLELSGASAQGQDADGAWTTQPGLACTMMVADCLPVLLCDVSGHWVGAVHAGWRGLAGQGGRGVLEAFIEQKVPLGRVEYAQAASKIIAWLGPCIGPKAFEVGDEVRDAFCAVDAQAAPCFVPLSGGKCLADLPALARRRLQRLGVDQVFGNDGSDAWCTFSNPSRFFSHRRDGISGRQAACVWIDAG